MKLVRKGNEVYFNDRKLTINPQQTKGLGNEVVKIEGLEGSNGQKWYSLSKLKQGENIIECKGREVSYTSSTPKKVEVETYRLTIDEQKKVDELKKQIEDIIDVAKKRYIPKPDMNVNPEDLTPEERLRKIIEVKTWYNFPLTEEEQNFKDSLSLLDDIEPETDDKPE